MNAVFQQLFMQPSIRKLLLAVPAEDPPTAPPDENLFLQFQVGPLACCVCVVMHRA